MPARPNSPFEFATFIHEHLPVGMEDCPLVNVTFFLGAGFSKSWDQRYPLGEELFLVPEDQRPDLLYVERAANFSVSSVRAPLTFGDIKQLVYTLDMYEKYPALHSRYVDCGSVRMAINQLRSYFASRLQQLVADEWQWMDPNIDQFAQMLPYTEEQLEIVRFFSKMFSRIDGSMGSMQGVRFNFITTNYDWLVERLIDASMDEDDSVFHYLYRGVTPELLCGEKPRVTAFSHRLVFNLLKLNGGLEIFRQDGRYVFDYRKRDAEEYTASPPILMLPSREQGYTDPYFLAIFPKAIRLLQESSILVVVGYSIPEDDALLRFIIRHFCEDEADSYEKKFFYIDVSGRQKQRNRLTGIFPFLEKHRVLTYSGSFSEWA